MEQVAVAVVYRDGRVLVGRRPVHKPLGGLLEFPGGKVLPGETPEQCAVREVLEETGLRVRVERLLETVNFDYSHASVSIRFFLCSPCTGHEPGGGFRWLPVALLDSDEFPPANATIIERLKSDAVS